MIVSRSLKPYPPVDVQIVDTSSEESSSSSSSSSSGGSFTPNDLSSIWAWYKASSYAQSDGSAITTDWVDQSPNNRDAVFNGSGMTYQTAELDGKDVLRTSGSGYFALPDMSALTGGEYFIIQKMNSITTSGGHRLGWTGGAAHYPFSGDNIYETYGFAGREDNIVTAVDMLAWHCTHGYSATNDWEMLQNGISIRGPLSRTPSFRSDPRIFNNGVQYMQCDSAELIFTSAKLSSDDRDLVEAYITGEYPSITFS